MIKIEIDISVAELTKGARVLVSELQKLGVGLPIAEAIQIITTLLTAFSKSKAEGEGDSD